MGIREELKYRLPAECCVKCNYGYFDTYGGLHCKHMPVEEELDQGGVCELFDKAAEKATVVVEEAEEDFVEEEVKSCGTCVLRAEDLTCSVDGTTAVEACNAWSRYG